MKAKLAKVIACFLCLSMQTNAKAAQAILDCRNHDGKTINAGLLSYTAADFKKYPGEGFAFEITGREIYQYNTGVPSLTLELQIKNGELRLDQEEIKRKFPCDQRKHYKKLREQKTYFCSAGSTIQPVKPENEVKLGEFVGCYPDLQKISDRVD